MAETKKKTQTEYPMALPVGAVLNGGQYSYRIEEVLGQGSYGITYRVSAQVQIGNITKEVSFAVKENFAKKYCFRKADGVTMTYPDVFTEDVERDLQDFLSEGKRLREICKGSKNIVKVNETWRENGTAYYAMEYIDGGNLCDYVKDRGRLSEKEAIDILNPVIDAVGIIHQHRFLHLDIKPENIMLEKRKGGGFEPILIDFGITLHFNQNGVITNTSKDHSIGCSDGYAPSEQYGGIYHFAPTADIYALGATLYYMLVGKDPRKAFEINSRQIENALPESLGKQTREAIIHAMNNLAEDRIQTTKDLKNELMAKTEVSDFYRLKIRYNGNGSVLRNNKALKNGSTYKVKKNSSNSITIRPDEGYKVESVKLNNNNVTSWLNGNTLTLNGGSEDVDLSINFIKESTAEDEGTVKYNKKEITIKSTGNGTVVYSKPSGRETVIGIGIRNSADSFKVNEGSIIQLDFRSDNNNHLKSVKVNNVIVTPSRVNNDLYQYIIDKISTDIVVDVTFEKEENVVVPEPDPTPNNTLQKIIVGVCIIIGLYVLYYTFIKDSSGSMPTPSAIEAEADSIESEYVGDYETEELQTSFDTNEVINTPKDSEKEQLTPVEDTPKQETNEDLFYKASKSSDWESMRVLAKKGYAPACGALAIHFVNSPTRENHCRAYYWAKKAPASDKAIVMDLLEKYGFLVNGEPVATCDNIIY